MKAYQKLGACALTALFMLLPCGCDGGNGLLNPIYTLTYTAPYAAPQAGVADAKEVDAALSERGYSELFIEWTGDETKRMLYDAGATFQTECSYIDGGTFIQDGDPWEDMYAHVTVSHVPTDEEGVVRKVVTYNWLWACAEPAEDDYILCRGDFVDKFSIVPEQTLLEVHGRGSLHNSQNVEDPEDFADCIFLLRRGADALSNFADEKTVESYFAVDPYSVSRQMQQPIPSYIAPQSGSREAYIDYHIRPNWYMGSYSLGFVASAEEVNAPYIAPYVAQLDIYYYHYDKEYKANNMFGVPNYRLGAWGDVTFDFTPDNSYIDRDK